jgi:hypothetical protein
MVIQLQSLVKKVASVSLLSRPRALRGISAGVMISTAILQLDAEARIPIAISTGMMYRRLYITFQQYE